MNRRQRLARTLYILLGVFALALAGCTEAAPPPGTGVAGTVWYGPTCPVQRDPPNPDCADRPHATHLYVWNAEGGGVVTEFDSAADGTYRIDLRPGEYTIRGDERMFGACQSHENFVVVSGAYNAVDVWCDSGIR